ncbi:adhesion G-protein coupled receptor G7 isoform X2 [Platichthys flesus]|uniref:adhesion G-protein coupled receptor G7 isoform X2 n=1 Tax=Platichthys flesus TaxID=8260 RepID=UPI002DB6F0F5|nr:adhesion G-protein coupled receptor G7 isoform X2 [Platichthys flesus]
MDVWFLLCFILASTTEAQFISTPETLTTANTTTTVPSTANTENITTTPSTANITTTPSTANSTTSPSTANTTTDPSTANTENITTNPSTANTENITTNPSAAPTTTNMSPISSTASSATPSTTTLSTSSSTASSATPTTNIISISSSTASSATPSTTNMSTSSSTASSATPSTTTLSTSSSTASSATPSTTTMSTSSSTVSSAAPTTTTMSTSSSTESSATHSTTTLSTSSSTATSATPSTTTMSTIYSTASSATPSTTTMSTSSSTVSSAAPTTTTMSTIYSTESSATPSTTTMSTSSSTVSSAAPTTTTMSTSSSTESSATHSTTTLSTSSSTASSAIPSTTTMSTIYSTASSATPSTTTMSTSSSAVSSAAPTTTTMSTIYSTASSATPSTTTMSTSSSTVSSAAPTTTTMSTIYSTASSATPSTTTMSTSSSAVSSAAPTTTTMSTIYSTASSAAPTTSTMSTSSSTVSSAAPPRPPPVECLNGGLLLDGVCLCADDWSGDTCSEENFCKAENLNGLNFPRTPVGWFSYSEELCLQGSGAGKPRAATRCSNNGSLVFEPPQFLQCSLTLSDILQNITTVQDYDMLATSAQILTSNPEELTAENVTTAAEITNMLLLSPNITESARTAAVATVSQLLNARVLDDTEDNTATLNLTQTLDELSLKLRSDPKTFESQVVQPNLVVQSAQVSAADTQGVQFTSLKGTSGSFVPDRIQLNTNTSTVVVENGFVADALIHVQFAPAADRNPEQSRVSLGFVLYQNNGFFRSSLYKARHSTVRVLSASVRGQNHRVVPQRVEMMFRPTLRSGTALYDFACVSWNYTLNDWSTAGCSKGNASDGAMRCICNHTTNFAALQLIIDVFEYAEKLGLTPILGLSLSILGLVVTIISLIKDKESLQSNKEVKIALLSLCGSLLGFIITFLTGSVQSDKADDELPALREPNNIPPTDEHVEPERISCTTVAFLLHFTLLATFMWISLYGHLMMKLTFKSKLPEYWTYLSLALGWGLPVVVGGITMAITYTTDNPQGYRQEEFCWLAALDKNKHFDFGKPMFWGIILPGTLIIIYNFVILIRIYLERGRKRPDHTSSSCPLAALVGFCCVFGYVVLNTTGRKNMVFSVLLCISGIIMGFLFFILFTVKTPSFTSSESSVQTPTFRSSASPVKSPQVNFPLSVKMSYNLRRPVEKTISTESYRSLSEDPYVTTSL